MQNCSLDLREWDFVEQRGFCLVMMEIIQIINFPMTIFKILTFGNVSHCQYFPIYYIIFSFNLIR